jgi:hypothetical protein
MIDTNMSCLKSNVRPSIEILLRFYRDVDRSMSLSIKNAIVAQSKLISKLTVTIGSLCTAIKNNGQRLKAIRHRDHCVTSIQNARWPRIWRSS